MDIGQVYTFKLNSGEEMIAKVIEESDGFITLEEPVSVAPGRDGMGLVPSMFTSEPHAQVTLNTSSVSLYATTEESVKFKYIEATTGLKLPEKKILVG